MMDQVTVVIKLAHDVRLAEANEQKSRIGFRLIFTSLRDGVEKRQYKYFQLYAISSTNAACR